jgi:hypothetical protein
MNLADLRDMGVEVRPGEKGKLRVRAAPGVLTEQLRQAIVEAKPRLLDELRGHRHRQGAVNVVNMVNFDAYCLTATRARSVANGKVHAGSNPKMVTAPDRPSGSLDGALSREAEAAVLAWLDQIGETDPAVIAEVLTACRSDPDALAYFAVSAARGMPKIDPPVAGAAVVSARI